MRIYKNIMLFLHSVYLTLSKITTLFSVKFI